MRLDSHQHFWIYSPQEYDWISEEKAVLQRDFLPDDLAPLLQKSGFEGSIAVQARQKLQETEWLLSLASKHEGIKGVVGWVDLRSPQIEEQLLKFANHPKLKAVRHVVQDEPDSFVLSPAFQNGIAHLKKYNLAYDLLIFPRQLAASIKLVEKFPQQLFVIDHIAKPDIKGKVFSGWKEDLGILAGYPNVHCKLSGMVTEADWQFWQESDFFIYMDIVFGFFGVDRLMIGSDWPVCTLGGSYEQIMAIVRNYIARFDSSDQEKIMGLNCAKFYNIQL